MAQTLLELIRAVLRQLFAAHHEWRGTNFLRDVGDVAKLLRKDAEVSSSFDSTRKCTMSAEGGMEVLLSTLAPPAYQLEGAWGSCAGAASGEGTGGTAGMATSVAGKGWQCLLEVVWARMEDAGRRPGSSFGAISTAGTMQLMPALCCRAPDFPGLLQARWRDLEGVCRYLLRRKSEARAAVHAAEPAEHACADLEVEDQELLKLMGSQLYLCLRMSDLYR
eukprot:Tamp_18435.p1 GENE.Tamp_18435~~Tamp_18435.p1  ORF type:complete len:234 (-),score=42.45 Tamp_18435:622-1284(-)